MCLFSLYKNDSILQWNLIGNPLHLALKDELKKPVPDLQSISSFHESIILSFDEKLIPSK